MVGGGEMPGGAEEAGKGDIEGNEGEAVFQQPAGRIRKEEVEGQDTEAQAGNPPEGGEEVENGVGGVDEVPQEGEAGVFSGKFSDSGGRWRKAIVCECVGFGAEWEGGFAQGMV